MCSWAVGLGLSPREITNNGHKHNKDCGEKVGQLLVIEDQTSSCLLYNLLFSLFLIPHSFFFVFFYIGIGTNSQTISADADNLGQKLADIPIYTGMPITDMISKQL